MHYNQLEHFKSLKDATILISISRQYPNCFQWFIYIDILNQSDFVNADSINSFTLQISQTLVGAAENCNMLKNKNNSSAKPQNRLKKQKPWFNKQSDLQHKEYLTAKRKHKQLNSGENLVSCSRKYKKLINKQMREYNSILTKKLKSMKNSDPKSYWSILNKYSSEGRDKLQKVSVESFYEHFSKLNEATPEKKTLIWIISQILILSLMPQLLWM